MALPSNLKLVLKGFPWTNALAYFVSEEVKSFVETVSSEGCSAQTVPGLAIKFKISLTRLSMDKHSSLLETKKKVL